MRIDLWHKPNITADMSMPTTALLLIHEAIIKLKALTLMFILSGMMSCRFSPPHNPKSLPAQSVLESPLLQEWQDVVISSVFRV
jgi:hypothetical protein